MGVIVGPAADGAMCSKLTRMRDPTVLLLLSYRSQSPLLGHLRRPLEMTSEL